MKEKTSYSFVLPLLLVFVLIQATGLYLGYKEMQAMDANNLEPIEDTSIGAFLFIELLIATAFLLLIIKYFKGLLRALLFIPMSVFVLEFFNTLFYGIIPQPIPVLVGAIASITIVSYALMKKDALSQNLLVYTAVTWAGASIGALLGFYPVLLFALLLTAYDYIAVFKTKHMVTMAKEIVKQKAPATMVIPTRQHVYQLGGGDLFIPMILSVSIMRELNLIAALFTSSGACIGMISTIIYLARRKKEPLPALPPIILGTLLGLLAYLIIFTIRG